MTGRHPPSRLTPYFREATVTCGSQLHPVLMAKHFRPQMITAGTGGAVKIDLENVLRVRRVYVAMHLNSDIASGRPGAGSYRADFRLERIDLPNLRGGDRGVLGVPSSAQRTDKELFAQPSSARRRDCCVCCVVLCVSDAQH